MTLWGMPQGHTILSPQLRLPSRTISMPRACSYVSRAREGLAERDGLCRHSIHKSKTFRAEHANFNQSVTMARLRPLTLGVRSSNVTTDGSAVSALPIGSRRPDGGPQHDASNIEILKIWV